MIGRQIPGSDVTGHEIVNGNIKKGMRNCRDGSLDHSDNTTTFSTVGAVFPKEPVTYIGHFGIQYPTFAPVF